MTDIEGDGLMFGEEPDDLAPVAVPGQDTKESGSAAGQGSPAAPRGQSAPPSPPLSDVVVNIVDTPHAHAGEQDDTIEQDQDDDTNDTGIDWAAIQNDYQAGVMSLRTLGKKYGVHFTTIHERSQRYGWVKSLTLQVQRRAEHELTFGRPDKKGGLGSDSQTDDPHAQAQAIEKAASVQVQIVQAHRADLSKLRRLQAQLTAKAEKFLESTEAGGAGLVIDLAALQTAVQTVESLARTVGRIIPLERAAFNIDAKQGPATEAQAIESRIRGYAERKKASPDDPQAIQRATRALNDARRSANLLKDARGRGMSDGPPGDGLGA